MFTSMNPAGRLVVLRIEWPFPPEQMQAGMKMHQAAMGRIPSKVVVVTDFRKSQIFPPEYAEKLIAMAGSLTDRIERSAFLLPESAIFGLQAERGIQEAGNVLLHRRLYRDAEAAVEWLSEVLGPEERRALIDFVGR